jgi:hypothetical protein
MFIQADRQALLAGASNASFKILTFENVTEDFGDIRIIFDDQDGSGYTSLFASSFITAHRIADDSSDEEL